MARISSGRDSMRLRLRSRTWSLFRLRSFHFLSAPIAIPGDYPQTLTGFGNLAKKLPRRLRYVIAVQSEKLGGKAMSWLWERLILWQDSASTLVPNWTQQCVQSAPGPCHENFVVPYLSTSGLNDSTASFGIVAKLCPLRSTFTLLSAACAICSSCASALRVSSLAFSTAVRTSSMVSGVERDNPLVVADLGPTCPLRRALSALDIDPPLLQNRKTFSCVAMKWMEDSRRWRRVCIVPLTLGSFPRVTPSVEREKRFGRHVWTD